MVVCTLGDLLLDVVVRVEGPVEQGGETEVHARVGAGGQAANVAAWSRELGAEARFIGKRAADPAGELVAAELAGRRVALHGPVAEARNGVVVSLVGDDGARTMLSDRGVAPELSPEDVDVRWLRGCDWLHLAGYSLFRRPIDEAAAKAVGAVRAHGGRISVDLSSATGIRRFGADALRTRLGALEPSVVFANEEEERALGGASPAETFVLKRGRDGIVVQRRGVDEVLPALPAAVVDTTGAGDALAAGFLVGGAELGLAAAARCVAQLGAMP